MKVAVGTPLNWARLVSEVRAVLGNAVPLTLSLANSGQLSQWSIWFNT